MIRGFVKTLDEAVEIHNAGIAKNVLISRSLGHLSHQFFVRLAASSAPEALEVLGLDVWMNEKGMMEYYMGKDYAGINMNTMFNGKPTSSIWKNPGGSWVEW